MPRFGRGIGIASVATSTWLGGHTATATSAVGAGWMVGSSAPLGPQPERWLAVHDVRAVMAANTRMSHTGIASQGHRTSVYSLRSSEPQSVGREREGRGRREEEGGGKVGDRERAEGEKEGRERGEERWVRGWKEGGRRDKLRDVREGGL